jgi:hypothetical protein
MTAFARLGSTAAIDVNWHLPLLGPWHADVVLATSTPPALGPTTLHVGGGAGWAGRVVRAGIDGERAYARVVGGSIDWTAPQTVQHYRDASVGDILGYAVGASTRLPFWTRRAGTAQTTLEDLAAHLGISWRVNSAGAVELPAATAPPPPPAGAALEISRDPTRGLVVVAIDEPLIMPGQPGIGDVIYTLDTDGEGLRARYFADLPAPMLRGAIERVVRWVMRDVTYLGTYSATVVAQNADGTLDLQPLDSALGSEGGLQSVPIRHGLPGVSVQVPAGETVLLAFDGGRPSAPYAALWHAGQVSRVDIGGTVAVALSSLVDARIATLKAALAGHQHLSAAPGSPTAPDPVSTALHPSIWTAGAENPLALPSVAATKLRTE